MSPFFKFLYFLIILSCFSCSSAIKKTNADPNPMDQFKVQLEQVVSEQLTGNKIMTPEVALNSLLEFHERYPSDSEIQEEDLDWLFFEYKKATAELNFSRSVVDSRNGQMYKYQLVLYYKAADFGSILDYENWSMDHPDLTSFKNHTLKAMSFRAAVFTTILRYEIRMERI